MWTTKDQGEARCSHVDKVMAMDAMKYEQLNMNSMNKEQFEDVQESTKANAKLKPPNQVQDGFK